MPSVYHDATAIYGLDPINGGQSIPAGTTYAQIDPLRNNTGGFEILERVATGATVITGLVTNPVFVNGSTFTLSQQLSQSLPLTWLRL
jgi:hypothetical protein